MIRVTTLKQGATKKNIQSILENLAKKLKPKGVDVYQYVGKISLQKEASHSIAQISDFETFRN